MSTSRQRVIRALLHQAVDRAPRVLQFLPGGEKCRADELAELLARYPLDIEPADHKYPSGQRAKGRPHEAGQHTDAWGCTWETTEAGESLLVPALPRLADAAGYRPPLELLEVHKMGRVNHACAESNRFVLAGSEVRPFDRLQSLCGCSLARNELLHSSAAIRGLLAMLHEFYCQELHMWAEADVDGVAFRDDWVADDSLLLPLEVFRSLFKPLYRDYCALLHEKDKFVVFQSHGRLDELLGDLIEVGVDAIFCRQGAADLERLAGEFRGRATFAFQFDGGLLCDGKPQEVRAAAGRIRNAFDFGGGGIVVPLPWGPKIPFSNVVALCEAWNQPWPMHAAKQYPLSECS